MINSGGQTGAVCNSPIRPRRLWYWVAGCMLAAAAACIALAVLGIFALSHQVRDLQRIPVPGHGVVTFAQRGGYVLFIERPGFCCSVSTGPRDSGLFRSWSAYIHLRPVNGGAPVAITTWRGDTENYDLAGHLGETAAFFAIDHPGRYELTASKVMPRSLTDFAIGRGIGNSMLFPVLLILAGLLGLIAAGLLTGVITAVRRRRARRAPLPVPPIVPQRPLPLPGHPGWPPGQFLPADSQGGG
ncbi:MAG TPA: hypothetical protein VK162_23330 [Streptosporangiaceae bacterium]|nr:hypothetical protein [Streptosporangiaceae bacterium]